MKQIDCLSFGSAGFDLLLGVEEVPGSDARVSATEYSACGGGPAATATVALARLGKSTRLVTAVGDDAIGTLIVDELAAEGIDISAVQRVRSVGSTVATVLIEPSGARSMAVYGGCIRAIDLDRIDLAQMLGTRAVLLDGNNPDLVRHVGPAAKAAGVPVLLDGGNIAAAQVPSLLAVTDIYIPDIGSARRQTPGSSEPIDLARQFAAMGPQTVCITMGEEGSLAVRGEEVVRMGAALGVAVRDTTGAGDNFHGAFQYGLLQDWPLDRILAFANAFAALTTRAIGGRSAIPTFDEAMRLAQTCTLQ